MIRAVFYNCLGFALMALWAAPALLGLFDTGCWYTIARQCTTIVWGPDRVFVGVIWMAILFLPVTAAISALPDDY